MRRFRLLPLRLLPLLLLPALAGCAYFRSIPELVYEVEATPVLPESETFYSDPIDSSVVWSQSGVQVKVKFFNDRMLDERYPPKFSPYTLTGWKDPRKGYTPPLWTTFEITVINRTRESVELDPTRAVLRLDNGHFYYCRQGVGLYHDRTHYADYSYLKWSGQEGNVQFYAQNDRNQIWNKSEYLREKPVRKGRKYSGMLTFPPLPEDVKSFTLEINDFILAFDKFEVGFGHPTEFTDIHFDFDVEQGVVEVAEESR